MKKAYVILSIVAALFITCLIVVLAKDPSTKNEFKNKLVLEIDTKIKNLNLKHYKGYTLTGNNYNSLELTFDDEFDDLTVSERYNALNSVMDIFDKPRMNLVRTYKLVKNYTIEDLSKVTAKTSKNNYSFSSVRYLVDKDNKRYSKDDFYASASSQTEYISVDAKTVWKFCKDRWAYYDKLENKYSGDKYTQKVFEEAGAKFGISPQKAKELWDKADKENLGVSQ